MKRAPLAGGPANALQKDELHLSLLALNGRAGDEVTAPAMPFCSTIHSIVRRGAQPVRSCDFPNATWSCERPLSIPLWAGMSEQPASDGVTAWTRILRYYKASA